MAIISLKFALFVSISLLIYYLTPGRFQNLVLLLASYFFYASWAWEYVLILFMITLFNFLLAKALHRRQRLRRSLLWIGVIINFAALLFYLLGQQYYDSIITPGLQGFSVSILLPLGFSYYALENISYLLDVNNKLIKPSSNFIHFSLYLAYFPKLISGPIERAKKFFPQLEATRTIDNEMLARSAMLILIGLFRSVVLAGSILLFVSPLILEKPQEFSNLELILGLLAFMFYLYNQFAGYTNIVRGVSGLFGIEITRNFAYPFFSQDFSDFWRRWHISLSSWLRDYIYMPLSRALLRRNPSRSNKANLILPPLTTMIASGIWHGGSLNILVWGAVNGIYIVSENLLMLFRSITPGVKKPWWQKVFSSIFVVGLMLLSMVPFFMDLPTTKVFFYNLMYGWKWDIPDVRPLVVVFVSLLLDWIQYRQDDEFIFLKWPRWARSFSASLAVFSILAVYNLQGAPEMFVYP